MAYTKPGTQHTKMSASRKVRGTPAAPGKVKRNWPGVRHEAEDSGQDVTRRRCARHM